MAYGGELQGWSMKATKARHYSHGSVFSILQTRSEMAHAPKINKEADRLVNIVLLREGGWVGWGI